MSDAKEAKPPLPCRWCGTLVPPATLATYGARCSSCYHAYLRAPQPSPLLPSKEAKAADPKAWVKALKRRDEAGENLTNAQRQMLRDAVRPHREEETEP